MRRTLVAAVLAGAVLTPAVAHADPYPTDRATPAPSIPPDPNSPFSQTARCYVVTPVTPTLGRKDCYLYDTKTGLLIPGSGQVSVYPIPQPEPAAPAYTGAPPTTYAAERTFPPPPTQPIATVEPHTVAPVATSVAQPVVTTAPTSAVVPAPATSATPTPEVSNLPSVDDVPLTQGDAGPSALAAWMDRNAPMAALIAAIVLAGVLVLSWRTRGKHRA